MGEKSLEWKRQHQCSPSPPPYCSFPDTRHTWKLHSQFFCSYAVLCDRLWPVKSDSSHFLVEVLINRSPNLQALFLCATVTKEAPWRRIESQDWNSLAPELLPRGSSPGASPNLQQTSHEWEISFWGSPQGSGLACHCGTSSSYPDSKDTKRGWNTESAWWILVMIHYGPQNTKQKEAMRRKQSGKKGQWKYKT